MDDAAPAWAAALVDAVNDGRAETRETIDVLRANLRAEAVLTQHRLERIEQATDRSTVAVKVMQIRLSLLETAVTMKPVTVASQSSRMEDLERRLISAEQRLALLGGPPS